MVRYWGCSLEHTGGDLRKRYGLIDQREATVPLTRVQALRIEESVLRRPLRLASIKSETAAAGSEKASRGAEVLLPLVRCADVPRLVAAVFEDFRSCEDHFRKVHSFARMRAFFRYAAATTISAAGGVLAIGAEGLWLLVLLPLTYIAADARYRQLGYRLPSGFVVVRSGFFNRVTWIAPQRKAQTVHLRESFLQRRRGLATATIDTAAGEAHIEDLGRREAVEFLRVLAD